MPCPKTDPVLTADCPVRLVIARFGDKWSMLVILLLHRHETVRFNELCRLIPDISSRVLSSTLRRLEADSLVSRKVYPVVPPRVEYALTETGRSLVPHVEGLAGWALDHMEQIVSHRRRFEQRSR